MRKNKKRTFNHYTGNWKKNLATEPNLGSDNNELDVKIKPTTYLLLQMYANNHVIWLLNKNHKLVRSVDKCAKKYAAFHPFHRVHYCEYFDHRLKKIRANRSMVPLEG